VLPLNAAGRLLITGPACDSLRALNNGWTITWQGDRPSEYPTDRPTVRRAIETRVGGRATYIPGADFDKAIDIAAAVAAARTSDVVVACLGENSYAETPGNIDELTLDDAQLALARALIETGKPVVLVLVEGRPRIVRQVVDGAAGVVLALNPGMEGGTAIADVLFGDVNPSGKLPITYPRFTNALTSYDHRTTEQPVPGMAMGYAPQFEFGFGLSYTTFEYSNLVVTPAAAAASGPVTVSVRVRNSGARPGAEVVEVFSSQHVGSVTPSAKRLRRFAKIMLQPDESREVSFRLDANDFSFVAADGRRVTEPGEYIIRVAGLGKNVTIR
jgi:beta-glucosidase